MSMTDEKVKRINELYHKAKAEGHDRDRRKRTGYYCEKNISLLFAKICAASSIRLIFRTQMVL